MSERASQAMPRAAGARLAEERNERPMSACAKRGDL
jgi:hypothetical protein